MPTICHTARVLCAADLPPLLDSLAVQFAWSDKARFQIELALEELMVNTFTHGHTANRQDQQSPITIDMLVQQDKLDLTISLKDNAAPFDPTKFALPDVSSSAEERKVGGLGLFFASKMMDSISHHYAAGCNHVLLRKCLDR